MVQRTFGKTGWRVGEIGVGGWQFGGPITLDGKPDGWTGVADDESIATVKRAVELGINFFDTSDQYGWGRSEEILGKALKSCRDRVYIATKVGFGQDAAGKRVLHESRDYIVGACDASLRRLQTDRIDLYQCHLWRTERWPEFLDAFDTLQRAGKIRAFGVSTNDFDMVQRFDERHTLSAVQCNYNLFDRRPERDIFPYCRARGIAVIARGVLAMGKLTGKYDRNSQFAADDIRSNWRDGDNRTEFDQQMDAIDRLRPVAVRAGLTLLQLAVKFALSHVAVSVVIVGVKNRMQVAASAGTSMLPHITHDEMVAVHATLAGQPAMLQMGKIFGGMVLWNLVLFAVTIALGLTHKSNHWQHQACGVLTGLYTCLTHCVVMMHFMGSGKGIKEAVATHKLPNDPQTGYTRRLRRLTARSSAMATFGSLATIIVVWLGGAKDTGHLHGMTHAVAAWVVLAFNLYAFRVEYQTVRENTAMIREINALIAARAGRTA